MHWASINSMLVEAVRANTSKRSGCRSMTSSVLTPMEPVDPSTTTRLFSNFIRYSASLPMEESVTRHPHGPIHRRAQEAARSEEHTSELQSQSNLVCRLLLVN